MTESKHTPGPWNLETVKTSIGVCHKIGPLGASTKINSACLYDDCYSDKPRDLQLLADAHLIAAAPELVKALEAIQDECEHQDSSVDRVIYRRIGSVAKAALTAAGRIEEK